MPEEKTHQADVVGIQNCTKVNFFIPAKYIPLPILRDSVKPLPLSLYRCYNVTTYNYLMFDPLIKKKLKKSTSSRLGLDLENLSV